MRPPTIEDIAQATAEVCGLSYQRLLGKEQTDEVAKHRYVAMYLSRLYTEYSYEGIAHFFNRKNHTSARTAFEKTKLKYQKNAPTKEKVDSIAALLGNPDISYRPTTTAGLNGRVQHNAHCPTCGRLSPLSSPCKVCAPKYNEEEWRAFIAKTIGGYITTALRYTKSFAEAEDCVWNVYGRLLEKDYSHKDLPLVGLRAVHNEGLNLYRRKSLRRPHEIVFHPSFLPPIEDAVDVDIIMGSLTGLLSKPERSILTSVLAGMSYQETSVAHGIKIGTVKSCVHRARRKIKKEFPEYKQQA